MQTRAVRLQDLAVAAAVTATYLLVGAYVNLPLREALKRAVGGVPYWLDHITFMLLAYLVVATLLAWKLVGLDRIYLRRPTDQRSWLVQASRDHRLRASLLSGASAFPAAAARRRIRGRAALGSNGAQVSEYLARLVEPLCDGLHRRQHLPGLMSAS